MKILQNMFSRIKSAGWGSIIPSGRRKLPEVLPDTFQLSKDASDILNGITSKTAQKLYKAKITPSGTDYGQYVYPAYVLDKKTDLPVEVIVKPHKISDTEEIYNIFEPETMQLLGNGIFSIDNKKGLINIDYLYSFHNEDYAGTGFILLQAAIERASMKNFKDVQLILLPKAYSFYRKLGFNPIESIEILLTDRYNEKMLNLAHELNIDETILRRLSVVREYDGIVQWTKDLSYEKILNYYLKNRGENTLEKNPIRIVMHLCDVGREGWEKIIANRSIFIGKEFPSELEFSSSSAL